MRRFPGEATAVDDGHGTGYLQGTGRMDCRIMMIAGV